MTASLAPAASAGRRVASPDPPATGAPLDAFPHTRRPLPWVLAGFFAILFLIPVGATWLRVHLPFDSGIDRFGIVAMVGSWMWFGGDQRAFLASRRSKLFVTAACVFLTLAVASLLFDAPRIINLGDFKLAQKQFALLFSFLALAWFTFAALRYEDLRGFTSYMIGLGTITAIGMLIERRTGLNVFYVWGAKILSPIAQVAPSPTDIHPVFGSDGRVQVVGPTQHGLAAATLLVMVMPFALIRVMDTHDRGTRLRNLAVLALLLAAAMATDKKTALLVPVAAVLFVSVYRWRQLIRYAPLAVVVLGGLIHFASPGALGAVLDPQTATGSASTTHRLVDISDLMPDFNVHPLLGRGYGSVDPDQPDQFRINDNQYLDMMWTVGALGLLAYIFLIVAPIITAHRAIRHGPPDVASLALAGAAGCFAFLVVNGLFDALSFPQAPYMFFAVAAITTIAAAGPEGTEEPMTERPGVPIHSLSRISTWEVDPAMVGARTARAEELVPTGVGEL